MAEPLYDVQTLWELVERRAAESPDRVMLLDEQDRRVTFEEFKRWAERTAAGFFELGVRESTRGDVAVADPDGDGGGVDGAVAVGGGAEPDHSDLPSA